MCKLKLFLVCSALTMNAIFMASVEWKKTVELFCAREIKAANYKRFLAFLIQVAFKLSKAESTVYYKLFTIMVMSV